MSYFQNPFDSEFRGIWGLDDRQYSIIFPIPANPNQSDNMVAWDSSPYDFSTDGSILTINYAWDSQFKLYSALAIDIAGTDPTATTVEEIVTILNANATFSSMFVASVFYYNNTQKRLRISNNINRVKQNIKVWISNTGAEVALHFNKKASVRELPTYFDRMTIENRFEFENSVGMLIYLDPSDPIDAQIITDAGFDPLVVKEDWELLRGKSGIFNFQKITVDGSDRIEEIIQYPAGAVAGDLARKIQYVYTGANLNPSQITEIPYTLTSGDLVTP